MKKIFIIFDMLNREYYTDSKECKWDRSWQVADKFKTEDEALAIIDKLTGVFEIKTLIQNIR